MTADRLPPERRGRIGLRFFLCDIGGCIRMFALCSHFDKMNGTYYKTDDDYLRDVVDPAKDVEGLCHDYNARHLFRARAKHRSRCQNGDIYVPCTALAVTKILEAYHPPLGSAENEHERWRGEIITVINRSEIMGRPLAAILALNGARVYSVDEDSILEFRPDGRMKRCTGGLTLERCLQQSTIVVTGVPSPHFRVPAQAIQDGTTIVNVSEFSNVDETDFLARPNVTLIPQVGKVTVAALEHNLVRLHQNNARQANHCDTKIDA